jgi:hypothetical protein
MQVAKAAENHYSNSIHQRNELKKMYIFGHFVVLKVNNIART